MENIATPVWDLDAIFSGGSDSPALKKMLEEVAQAAETLTARVKGLGDNIEAWTQFLSDIEEAFEKLTETGAFIACLTAQDVRDKKALVLLGQVRTLSARLMAVATELGEELKNLPDSVFQAILSDPRNASIAFALQEARDKAARRMDIERELLANDLAVDGYHAFNTLYDSIVGRITIEMDGEQLSVGQAYNRFSDPDRAKRKDLFEKWEAAWAEEAELIAHALNHLAGFRLNLYKHRGWEDILEEPLENNRIEANTLEAMWSAVSSFKPTLKPYLDRKAQLLGAQRLAWYDTEAPIGKVTRTISYADAAGFIVEQFGKFSPRMAEFAERAFDERWIEAEDRPYKRPGGFCTSFPLSKQSRIFMTFSGTAGGQSTLAHELGHAFHHEVMNDLRYLACDYPMSLAETASTFAELLVSTAAIREAKDPEERSILLAQRLDDAVAYLMNIHARFLFETRFYERRKKGLLSVDELNELMKQAQEEAFADGLETYHPYFWASKLHFYATGQPFYNFPYTFGFLFSAALYARAEAEGPSFERKYIELLRDTGSCRVEELAKKHLDADLQDEAFWLQGLALVKRDLDQFLELTARSK